MFCLYLPFFIRMLMEAHILIPWSKLHMYKKGILGNLTKPNYWLKIHNLNDCNNTVDTKCMQKT